MLVSVGEVVVLARELGLELELKDVAPDSLVPEALQRWKPSSADRRATSATLRLRATTYTAGSMSQHRQHNRGLCASSP